jgi:hypothetical protein
MKKEYLVIVLGLLVGQVFGQKMMRQTPPSEAFYLWDNG